MDKVASGLAAEFSCLFIGLHSVSRKAQSAQVSLKRIFFPLAGPSGRVTYEQK